MMKKNRILFFALFVLVIFISYYLSVRYRYHMYYLNEHNLLKSLTLFVLQGAAMYFAINSLFVKKHINIALLLNSVIIYVCSLFTFVMETLYSTDISVPMELVINSLIDPNVFLLHFAFCIVFFMLFKFQVKQFRRI